MISESVYPIFVALLIGRSQAFFSVAPSQRRTKVLPLVSIGRPQNSSFSSSSVTILKLHQFNGGYDPASPLTWTPQQAAEFTMFHQGEPMYIGLQLRTAIKRWTGTDLAEFLTRLYLGQKVEPEQQSYRSSSLSPATIGEESKHRETKSKIVYEPQNVRTPQWRGLETREGVLALKELLKEALSPDTMDPREIARFAEAFLLKEYKWPNQRINPIMGFTTNKFPRSNNNTMVPEIAFEHDSFYSRGHSKIIARIILWIRKERSVPFKWEDIVAMVTLLEHEQKEARAMQLTDFYETLVAHIPLTTKDKTRMVERLALGGWSSSDIPKFIAKILPDEERNTDHTLLEDGSFGDIPSATERDTRNNDNASRHDNQNEESDRSSLGAIEDQVLLVSTLKRATLSLRSEYDQLVQSYWKQLERPNAKKKLQKDNKRNSKRGTGATKASPSNALLISHTGG
jgi:hypothetical protein